MTKAQIAAARKSLEAYYAQSACTSVINDYAAGRVYILKEGDNMPAATVRALTTFKNPRKL